nr:efflux RND transporter periplasmic adaptor subunit [uncultured Roseateles sp.]
MVEEDIKKAGTASTRLAWLAAHWKTALPALLLVLLLAVFLLRQLQGPQVKTLSLQPRDFVQTVVASARVQTQHRVDLGSQVTGTILSVAVTEGDDVKAGQVLAELDAREARAVAKAAALAVAQAELKLRQLKEVQAPVALQADKQAAANLAQAKAQFTRQHDLFKQGFIGQAALDEAQRALDVAQAQASSARTQLAAHAPNGSELQLALTTLAEAQANAEAAQARLNYTQIKAPVAGQVIDRNVEPGQVVQAGKALFVLSPQGITELIAQIDEKNMGLLRQGLPALASADAYAQQRFKAQVSLISPGVDAQRGSVELRLRVAEPPDYLRQDMTVSVEIEVARRPQALVLPLDALHESASAAPWVWVLDDAGQELRRTELKLGLRSGGWVEVLQGLQAGQQVLTEASPGLRAGQRVRAVAAGASSPGG